MLSLNLLTASGLGGLGACICRHFQVWEAWEHEFVDNFWFGKPGSLNLLTVSKAWELEFVDSFRFWRPGSLNLLTVSGFGVHLPTDSSCEACELEFVDSFWFRRPGSLSLSTLSGLGGLSA